MARTLTTIILAAFVLYGAYWFIGKSSRETQLAGWFSERSEAGWVADTDIQLRGFPNRYDAVLTDLNLADPASGWAWRAPRFELIQLTYQPNHYIAVWPQEQVIASPNQRIDVASENMKASFIFEPRSDFTLDRATLTTDSLSMNSTAGWKAAAEEMVLALRQSGRGDGYYDIALKSKNLAPSGQILRQLDRAGVLPDTFETFELNAIAGFSERLSQASFQNGTSDLREVDLQALNMKWGEMALRAAGRVDVDREGYPIGKITLRAENWKQMLDLGISAGWIDENMGSTLKSGLSLLARFSGNENTLDVPLSFSNKSTKLGPITLGPAPRLKL